MFRKTAYVLFITTCLAAISSAQVPVIGDRGILNGASFRQWAVPGSGIAPGAIISIFGYRLATATGSAASVPLPLNIGGTSVTIGGKPAPLFFVSYLQINAQVPWSVATGSQPVVVTVNGTASAAIDVVVQPVSPGIFTQTASGKGAGLIQNYVSATSTPMNNTVTAAAPGGLVVIYATGLGPVDGPPADGAAGIGQSTSSAVTVKVGAATVTPQFAGLAPGFAGLYQVNVQLPSNLPQGCNLPVQLEVDRQVSNTVTLAVASTGNCTTLASESYPAPSSTYGTIDLSRSVITFPPTPGVGVSIHPNAVSASFMKFGPAASPSFIAPPAGGGCLVDFFRYDKSFFLFPDFAVGVTSRLDPGTLTYTPAGGSPQTINTTSGTSVLEMAPGTHTVAGAGDKDVGAFSVSATIPGQFNGKADITGATVSQATGFSANWICPDPNGVVIVGAYTHDPQNTVQGTVICTAACSAGSYKVGPDVLRLLPSSYSTGAGVFVGFGGAPVRFIAPGLDAGYFLFWDFAYRTGLTLTP